MRIDDVIYLAWRDSEAWAVPMTAIGQTMATRRWMAFKKGWEACKKEYGINE